MKSYTFAIDEADIHDLRSRLAQTRWAEQLPGASGWSKGVPVAQARAWAQELADFDWQSLQTELNALPQFTDRRGNDPLHPCSICSK